MGNLLNIASSVVGIGGAIKDLGSKKPQPVQQSFTSPFTTPAYRFGGGKLTRTDTSLLDRERSVFEQLAAINPQLAALISKSNESGIALGGLRAQAAGLSNPTQTLFGNVQDIDRGLRDTAAEVRPGFGRLTESAVNTIRSRGAEALGGLKDNLARRGVLGASFANDQESRLRQEVAQQEEQARSQALISEIALTNDIATRRMAANELGANLVKLDQANIALQGQLIAQQMGVTQQQAAIFGQQLQTIQAQQQAIRDQVTRELGELGIAAEFLSKVNQVLDAEGANQIGSAISGLAGQNSGNQAGRDDPNDPLMGYTGGFPDFGSIGWLDSIGSYADSLFGPHSYVSGPPANYPSFSAPEVTPNNFASPWQ